MARHRRRRNPGMGLKIALGLGAVALTGGAVYLFRSSVRALQADIAAGKTPKEALDAQQGKQWGAAGLLVAGVSTGAALGASWGAVGAAIAPAVVLGGSVAVSAALGPVKPAEPETKALEGAGPVRLFTPYA